jgi:penicillin-insensitive murein endopeptidase
MSLAAVVTFSALVAGAATAQDHADAGAAASDPVMVEVEVPGVVPEATPGAGHATRAGHTKAARATHTTTRRTRRRTTPATRPPDPGDGTSLSVGRHNRGRLLRSHELHESETLRFKTPHSEAHFGTDELVGLLERASRAVAIASPGERLTIGDLSRRGGGRFSPHRSHQSGRDADVGFYVFDGDRHPLDLDRFFDFRRDGTVRGHDELHYDFVRNWQLVEALVTDEVPVQWIFIERGLRGYLLQEGARLGASPEVLAHAEAILSQPSRGGRHNDHFHVRIYCPAADHPRCLDDPPIHPWMAGAPPVAPPTSPASSSGAQPEGD